MTSRMFLSALVMYFAGFAVTAASELGAIPVSELDQRAAVRELRTVLPEAHHVVIFARVDSAHSQAYLHALRREGYPGFRTTLVLLTAADGTSRSRAPIGALDLNDWQNANILRAEVGGARGYVGSSLPLVVGVDEVGKTIWRRSGRSHRAAAQTREMLEWLQ